MTDRTPCDDSSAMQIVLLTERHYQDWNDFCLESDGAWFFHTTDWLVYTLNYRPELAGESKSFFVTDGSRMLAICPLILETHLQGEDRFKEFSYSGSFGVTPALVNDLSEKYRSKLFKRVFNHVDNLALQNEVQRMSIQCSPLIPSFLGSCLPQSNWLLRYGMADVSVSSHIIDLSADVASLMRHMRSDVRKNIRRASRRLEVEIFDHENVSLGVFDQYREMHHRAAGKVTRPLVTFEMMYEWIQRGFAVLFGARLAGEFVGFYFVVVYKSRAISGSSCRDVNHLKLPIGHFLNWEIVRWLKERGFQYYTTGIQQYGWLPHNFPSAKEVNIAAAKRGLGGYVIPCFHGEKFYSRDYYLQVTKDRMEYFGSALPT